MPLLQVIVLAIVQGLTEFLPISSTAHLYLTSWLFGWQVEGLDFDIALHIGTLLAVLLYFARDWMQIIAQGFGIRMRGDDELKHNHMLLWLLVIGTIPVGIAGLVFNKQAEDHLAQSVRDRRHADRRRHPHVVRGKRRAQAARSVGHRPARRRRPSAWRRRWPSCPAPRAAASPSPPDSFAI